MMKKLITILILAILVFPTVLSETQENFTAKANSLLKAEKCTTIENIILLTNTGDITSNYLLETEGQIKQWIQYPGIFSLKPGKTVKIKTEISIPCTTPEGIYQIKTIIRTTNGIQKTIIQDLEVKPTQNIIATTPKTQETIKPCQKTQFEIEITNPASFEETYSFSADNPNAKLSTDKITLKPNQTKQIQIEIEPQDCTLTDTQKIKFTAETQKTQLIAELNFEVTIENYGVPSIAEGINKIRTYYNKNTVDIEIKNTGTKQTSYILSSEGPEWASIEPKTLTIAGQKTQKISLYFEPAKEVPKDKYTLKIIAENEETGAQYEKQLTIKLTTPGIIDNLFDKYLPLTVLIIVALIIFGIITIYALQYTSTEEYQKNKLKKLKEKEKHKRQKKREKERKRKEKQRLKKERKAEKQRIKEQKQKEKQRRQKQKQKAKKDKEKARKQKAKEEERKKKEQQTLEKKAAKKYENELKKEYHLVAKKDIIERKQPRYMLQKILLLIILLALLVLVIIFIKPIINNITYFLGGIAILLLLLILRKIKSKRITKTKWKELTLVNETKAADTAWKKGLQQTKIKLNTPAKKLWLQTKKGKGRNPKYICIDEQVYQYFRTESNIEDNELKQAEFLFKVSKKWIKSKNIDKKEITLFNLDNGEWEELKTTRTDQDKSYLYFKAKSEKLGVFAIVCTEKPEEPEDKETTSKSIIALLAIIGIAIIILLLIKPVIQTPQAGIPSQKLIQGHTKILDLNKYFQDPDGDTLEFAIKNKAQNINIWIKNGQAYITPDADFTGERTVVFTADDGKGGYAESNPVKLIVHNALANTIKVIIKYGLGAIIIIVAMILIVKLFLLVKKK